MEKNDSSKKTSSLPENLRPHILTAPSPCHGLQFPPFPTTQNRQPERPVEAGDDDASGRLPPVLGRSPEQLPPLQRFDLPPRDWDGARQVQRGSRAGTPVPSSTSHGLPFRSVGPAELGHNLRGAGNRSLTWSASSQAQIGETESGQPGAPAKGVDEGLPSFMRGRTLPPLGASTSALPKDPGGRRFRALENPPTVSGPSHVAAGDPLNSNILSRRLPFPTHDPESHHRV